MKQTSLLSFGKSIVKEKEPRIIEVKEVPGLTVIENFITQQQHDTLMKGIYSFEWNDTLKRRVQHYGYAYDYRNRGVSSDTQVPPIPECFNELLDKLQIYFGGQKPEQLIINEYTPGQGIAPHIDALVFGDPIISLSLGSTCEFIFQNRTDSEDSYSIILKPNTLVIMSKDSRYKYTHCIPKRKVDYDETTDKSIPRGTRVSLTFRMMKK